MIRVGKVDPNFHRVHRELDDVITDFLPAFSGTTNKPKVGRRSKYIGTRLYVNIAQDSESFKATKGNTRLYKAIVTSEKKAIHSYKLGHMQEVINLTSTPTLYYDHVNKIL